MIRQFSAGGVVFKKEDENQLWLLIRPKSEKVRWQLPKGMIDEGERSEIAALREVAEEGGVKAEAVGKIDSFQIIFRNTFEGKPQETVIKMITFFLMSYLGETGKGHDEEVAEIAWLPFEEAKERLTFKNEKEILEKARQILLAQDSQPSLF